MTTARAVTGDLTAAATATVDVGAVVGVVIVWIALALVAYAWLALALATVFRKVGVAPWRGWVPVLNLFTLLEIGGYSGWIALAAVVPLGGFVVWVFVVLAAHRINASFGYGGGMTVLAAVLLPLWASVVGFGPARWLGRAPGRRAPQPLLADGPPPPSRSSRGPETAGPASPGPEMRPPPPLPPAPPWSPAAVPAAPAAPPARYPMWPAVAAVPHAASPGSSPPLGYGATGDERGDGSPAALSWMPIDPPAAATAAPVSAPAPAPAADWSRRSRRDQAAAAAGAEHATSRRGTAEPPLTDVPGGAASDEVATGRALRQPRYSPWAQDGVDDLDDLPDEVSAAHTIPGVGAPRSARAAVSSQHAESELADDEQTVVARRRAAWELVLPLGPPVPIAGSCVILGRRPAPEPEFPDAQLVRIVDETRTVSKRHARLDLRPDGWWIVDLHSTNGVLLETADGGEYEVEPGTPHPAGDRFLLGDAEVRIQRGPGA